MTPSARWPPLPTSSSHWKPGQELAVPATKTVTAQLASFAIIAQALGDIGLDDKAAGDLPGQVAQVLSDQVAVTELAGWLSHADRLVTVARGILYGAAGEAALKVEETTSFLTAAFSAADLRHGPIAIASNAPPVLAFAHPGPASEDVVQVVAELRAARGQRPSGRAGRRERPLLARLGPGGRGPGTGRCERSAAGALAGPGARARPGRAARPYEGHGHLTRRELRAGTEVAARLGGRRWR